MMNATFIMALAKDGRDKRVIIIRPGARWNPCGDATPGGELDALIVAAVLLGS